MLTPVLKNYVFLKLNSKVTSFMKSLQLTFSSLINFISCPSQHTIIISSRARIYSLVYRLTILYCMFSLYICLLHQIV